MRYLVEESNTPQDKLFYFLSVSCLPYAVEQKENRFIDIQNPYRGLA
jgi:hypothetical protein